MPKMNFIAPMFNRLFIFRFYVSRTCLENFPGRGYDRCMCWYCGKPVTDAEPLGRSLVCACGRDLRCCRNCRHFDPGSARNCRETQAEGEKDGERSNFCDWFSLNPRFRAPHAPSARMDGVDSAAAAAKSAFDRLFQ
jgi:hypothetical protein